jgi:hypothetical protein
MSLLVDNGITLPKNGFDSFCDVVRKSYLDRVDALLSRVNNGQDRIVKGKVIKNPSNFPNENHTIGRFKLYFVNHSV